MNANLVERIGGHSHMFTGRTMPGWRGKGIRVQVRYLLDRPTNWTVDSSTTVEQHTWIPLEYLNPLELQQANQAMEGLA